MYLKIKGIISGALRAIDPKIHTALRQILSRTGRIERKLLIDGQCIVREGPFQGMRLVDQICGSRHFPKVIGCYEQWLHPWILEEVSRKPPVIVDIGCAEGYYAVGFARLLKNSKIVAFDISNDARRICRENAILNNVAEQVFIENECTAACLESSDLRHGLIFCDCEGYEDRLFGSHLAEKLSTCSVIVECHESPPGFNTAEKLVEIFKGTHQVRLASNVLLNPHQIGRRYQLNRREAKQAIDEGRSHEGFPIGQIWCYFKPREK